MNKKVVHYSRIKKNNSGLQHWICLKLNFLKLSNSPFFFLYTQEQAAADLAAKNLHDTLTTLGPINSQKILQNLKSEINDYTKYLPAPVSPETFGGLDTSPKIDEILYGRILELLITKFNDNWPILTSDNTETLDPAISRLTIINGTSFPMFQELLIILTASLKKSTNPRVTNAIVLILKNLIKSEAPFSAITCVCKKIANAQSPIIRQDIEDQWLKTLQILLSLPSRIANKLAGKIDDAFTPETFALIIILQASRAISFINLIRNKSLARTDVKMISMLLSKSILVLAMHRFEYLVKLFSAWCIENPKNIQTTIIEILRRLDRSAIHPLAVYFLTHIETTDVEKVFSDLINDPQWRNTLTSTIPLMCFTEGDKLVKNLVAYLPTSLNDDRILPELLIKWLSLWSNRNVMNSTSLEQHLYLTKLIILGIKKTSEFLTQSEKDKMIRELFAGTSSHLESTQIELRAIGMITGEMVIELLNANSEAPKLKYDYEGMPEEGQTHVKNLRLLLNSLDEKSSAKNENTFNNCDKMLHELGIKAGVISGTISVTKKSTSPNLGNSNVTEKEVPVVSKIDEDLDSDDDLTPYDMSNDRPMNEKHRPIYLRDMLENFTDPASDLDPCVFSESMNAAEDLILEQLSKDDSSFAIELLMVFVGLRENSYVENFEALKFKACVAIVLTHPKDSAKYLCNEFHRKVGEYSIKDRLFILEILSESARRFSKIEMKSEEKKSLSKRVRKRPIGKPASIAIDQSDHKRQEFLYDDDFEMFFDKNDANRDWEDVIDRRIETNTRRFVHATKLLPTTMNKFNDVVAAFFYPLLYGFRQKGTCMYATPQSYEDHDNILLVSYLKTLATIMIVAENCVIVPAMAKEILDLVWSLRYHSQAKVRLCVIQNTAAVVVTLPKESLTTQIFEQILEMRRWLEDVSADGVMGDPDSSCRNLGRNVVELIDSVYRSTITEGS